MSSFYKEFLIAQFFKFHFRVYVIRQILHQLLDDPCDIQPDVLGLAVVVLLCAHFGCIRYGVPVQLHPKNYSRLSENGSSCGSNFSKWLLISRKKNLQDKYLDTQCVRLLIRSNRLEDFYVGKLSKVKLASDFRYVDLPNTTCVRNSNQTRYSI